jgi:peptide-methionine (S)-S-oxide reductase
MNIHIFITVLVLFLGIQTKAEPRQMKKSTGNTMSVNKSELLSEATLGNGCFWCSEAIFSRITGVHSVTPGYTGGHKAYPSYEEVCTGNTGHAEVVRIVFNPQQISYLELLQVFFKTHDPTTLNRQGADIGTQYRSVVFYHSEEQKRIALEVKEELNNAGIWDKPIVTEISELGRYYDAEKHHWNYFAKNPDQAYCQFVVLPKVDKFEELFRHILKKEHRATNETIDVQ